MLVTVVEGEKPMKTDELSVMTGCLNTRKEKCHGDEGQY